MEAVTQTVAPLPPVWRFSTDELPETNRFGTLNEAFGRMFLCDMSPFEGAEGHAYTKGGGIILPGVKVTLGEGAGLYFTRGARHTTERDDVSISISQYGRAEVAQRGSEYVVGPGQAYVDLGDEMGSVRHMRGDARRDITIIMPRRIFEAAGTEVDIVLTRPIPRESEALRLLIAYAMDLCTLAAYPPQPLATVAAAHICDLAVLAIGATGDTAEAARTSLRAARLAALKRDLAGRIGSEPDSLGETARRHGISPSYVRKLFEGEGTSFSAYVLRLRLDRARLMLTSPLHRSLSISAIAFDCGFSDLSYFNRSFRRRFGGTPSDIRAGVL